MTVSYKKLKAAVTELNEKICNPPIKLKKEKQKQACKKVLEAAGLIEKGDKISKSTMAVIKALKGKKAKKADKAEKSSKKTSVKKNKGVGVLATIQSLITEKPISKAEILKALVKKFPDRKEAGMAKTINAQLPNRMAKERGIKIVEKDGKYSVKGKKA